MKTSTTIKIGRSRLIFKILVLNIVMLLCVSAMSAQTPAVFDDPGGETGGDGNGSFGDGPVVPLDGGMSLLLLAGGIGYVQKRVNKNFNKN